MDVDGHVSTFTCTIPVAPVTSLQQRMPSEQEEEEEEHDGGTRQRGTRAMDSHRGHERVQQFNSSTVQGSVGNKRGRGAATFEFFTLAFWF